MRGEESYVRLSSSVNLVRNNEQVYSPHYVCVLEDSLLTQVPVCAGLTSGGWLVVNTVLDQVTIQDAVGRKDINIATIDADTIAVEVLGRAGIVNTIVLGALIRISNLFTLDEMANAIMARFKGEIAAKNVAAIKRAYEETCIYESSSAPEIDFTVDSKVKWAQVFPGLPGYKELDSQGAWKPEDESMPVEVGSHQVQTGNWTGIEILWDEEKCSQCASCWYICPDFCIIRELQDDQTYKMVGIDVFHCKGCENCLNICPVGAISKQNKAGPASCAAPE